MHRALVPATLLLLAACARSEDASTLPTDINEVQPVENVRSIADDDNQVALGEWRTGIQEERSALEFGPAGTAPLFSMVCGNGGGLILQRHGAVDFEGLQMMTIGLGGQTRRVAVTAVQGTVPMLRASIPATGPLLEEIAREQGPITIRTADSGALILPHSPMIVQYIRGCGNAPRLPEAPGNSVGGEAPAAAPAGNSQAGNSL
jgi:hypothetical protein